jgi:putative SbcD/Mre11-related phosphoesterase
MKGLSVSDDLTLFDRAAYLPTLKTLVVADLQIGWEASIRRGGVPVPLDAGKELVALFETLLEQTAATRVVIAGDLKHDFGRISRQERDDLELLLRFLLARVEVVLVRGNHDSLTEPIANAVGLELQQYWREADVLVVHGHEVPDAALLRGVKLLIAGHTHPAITISDGVRKERYKCFLLGKYKRKQLLVLPSCSLVVEGTDVLQEQTVRSREHSPLLQGDASVYLIADEMRPFGRLSQLRRLLG